MFERNRGPGFFRRAPAQTPGARAMDVARQGAHGSGELDRLAAVFHELRTLLFSIRGFTRLLLGDKVSGTRRQTAFLAIMDKDLERMTRLVDEVLSASAFDGGGAVIRGAVTRRDLVFMPEIINEVVARLAARAAERRVAVNTDLPQTLLKVVGDERQLKQVVANLLSDAIKFSPQNSKVVIRARVRDGQLLWQVSGSGIGIPEKAILCISERSCRIDSGGAGGVGLGLYIAKRIVEAHGGRMWVENGKGGGSTLSFTVPLATLSTDGVSQEANR